MLAPLLLFVCFYLATFFLLSWLRLPLVQWSAFLSACVASAATIAIWERGAFDLGVFVSPRLATRDFALGSVWGVVLIGSCAILVSLSSDIHHAWRGLFPWRELAALYIPAAVHEELLFRGYLFQKLVRWNRMFAIVFGALVFAWVHAGNNAVTPLALVNIFLGGLLLGLAYLRFERLWFPIGLHLSWNLMTGPILGDEVSGFDNTQSLLAESGKGVVWITGGEFGLEGSVWATVVELVAIALLVRSAYHPRSPRFPDATKE